MPRQVQQDKAYRTPFAKDGKPMTEFDMPADPEQADLMHGLIDAGHTNVKAIAYDAETSERTAYRIVSGDTPLTAKHCRALIRVNDRVGRREVGDVLTRFILRGTERLAVDLTTNELGDVHGQTVEALRRLLDFLEQRRNHEHDGIITPAEAREEVEAIDECLHVLHRARKAVAEQPTTTRRQARPLTLTHGEGGVA